MGAIVHDPAHLRVCMNVHKQEMTVAEHECWQGRAAHDCDCSVGRDHSAWECRYAREHESDEAGMTADTDPAFEEYRDAIAFLRENAAELGLVSPVSGSERSDL